MTWLRRLLGLRLPDLRPEMTTSLYAATGRHFEAAKRDGQLPEAR